MFLLSLIDNDRAWLATPETAEARSMAQTSPQISDRKGKTHHAFQYLQTPVCKLPATLAACIGELDVENWRTFPHFC